MWFLYSSAWNDETNQLADGFRQDSSRTEIKSIAKFIFHSNGIILHAQYGIHFEFMVGEIQLIKSVFVIFHHRIQFIIKISGEIYTSFFVKQRKFGQIHALLSVLTSILKYFIVIYHLNCEICLIRLKSIHSQFKNIVNWSNLYRFYSRPFIIVGILNENSNAKLLNDKRMTQRMRLMFICVQIHCIIILNNEIEQDQISCVFKDIFCFCHKIIKNHMVEPQPNKEPPIING